MYTSASQITNVASKYLSLSEKVHQALDDMKKFMESQEYLNTVEYIDDVVNNNSVPEAQVTAVQTLEDSCMPWCYESYIDDVYASWKN